MKYFETLLEEQETLINVLYDEHKIRVYSNRIEVIKNLTKAIGKPTKRYKKNKTYWSGATWEIDFNDFEKINVLLNRNFILAIYSALIENETGPIANCKDFGESNENRKSDDIYFHCPPAKIVANSYNKYIIALQPYKYNRNTVSVWENL